MFKWCRDYGNASWCLDDVVDMIMSHNVYTCEWCHEYGIFLWFFMNNIVGNIYYVKRCYVLGSISNASIKCLCELSCKFFRTWVQSSNDLKIVNYEWIVWIF